MNLRAWWAELPIKNVSYNFLWQPTSNGISYDELGELNVDQMVNHFEFHNEISLKSNLFLNLRNFCEVLYIR